MKTRVKICGITNASDARAAVQCGADFLGFVFYPKSPRYLPPQEAKKFVRNIAGNVKKVGVFVNEAPGTVEAIAEGVGLDMLQFHGDEDPEYLKKFKRNRVIKALRIKDAASLKEIGRYEPDFFLFDAFAQEAFGGTGATFDWQLLGEIAKTPAPYFISGGLTPSNVGELLGRVQPYAVDVSSGVELEPGKKSFRLMKDFIKQIPK